MKTLLLGLAAAFMATTAIAQTSSDVLDSYRAYTAALEARDGKMSLKHARDAYKAADAIMPEAAQTGVLAENLADITPAASERLDLYERAIELLHPDADAERRVELMLKRAETHMYLPAPIRQKDVRAAEKDVQAVREVIGATGLSGTTYDAEALVVDAWTDNFFGRESKALDKLDQAQSIFEGPDHTLFSALEYQAYLIKGEVLKNQGKPIEGAVELQKVMQNLEGELPVDHPFISRAFSSWLSARNTIQQKGLQSEALAGGVCKCWPYDEISENSPVPLQRMPPIPPRNAKRSGFVDMKFDLDREGHPINIRAVSGTSRMFVKPSVAAIKTWRYDVQPTHSDEDLKGIATRMTFKIIGRNGKAAEEAPLQVWERPEADG